MEDERIWRISIPVRPKAVQSVRGGSRGFYADPAVTKWKKSIRPFIARACGGRPPSGLPMRINRIDYIFRAPKSAPKRVLEFIEAGGVVPYLTAADVTDNLAKGLVDTCAGLVFTNDKNIWWTAETRKLYGIEDGIYIEFEETPGIMLIDGTFAGRVQGDEGFFC